jgi:hypothetical protein
MTSTRSSPPEETNLPLMKFSKAFTQPSLLPGRQDIFAQHQSISLREANLMLAKSACQADLLGPAGTALRAFRFQRKGLLGA